ncbi:MAG TPA: GDP-mannose 4,6-dehydratase [Candidatus Sulfotelmatobacter sp.]|nr:GDP-mannose 4,6-dehydratase [Candidatus Sulfotelmatobacter sp.]HEV2417246.1 GDP-mannose 4,6-dehydratase [Terriglobia bacterium]
MKKALITRLSGQDRSYLAEYPLALGYEADGLVHREAASMRWLQPVSHRMEMIYGDLRDATSVTV